MACNICEATNYFNILNKVSIPIWTGSSEIEVANSPVKLVNVLNVGMYMKIYQRNYQKNYLIYIVLGMLLSAHLQVIRTGALKGQRLF